MPPRTTRKHTPGSTPAPSPTSHRLEADVVGLLQRRDAAAAVEGDVEFARQAVSERSLRMWKCHCARQGPGVDELLWIDARRRAAGDVANVVGAGAARTQAEVLDGLDDLDGVLRRDLADLNIGARRDMRIAAAIFSARSARPANCQCDRLPLGMRSRHM